MDEYRYMNRWLWLNLDNEQQGEHGTSDTESSKSMLFQWFFYLYMKQLWDGVSSKLIQFSLFIVVKDSVITFNARLLTVSKYFISDTYFYRSNECVKDRKQRGIRLSAEASK